MIDNKIYTSFLLKITDEFIAQDNYIKDLTTEEILQMIDKEINSKEFLERIENGLYGEYIPEDTDSIVYFKQVESHISMPLTSCIKIESVYLEDDTLYVQYKILDTPFGCIAYDSIQDGKIPCFSLNHTMYINIKTNKVVSISFNSISISAFLDEEEIEKYI